MPVLDASVLICTFNRSQLLGEALDSLAAMRHASARTWEVVIVDNNSTDDTAQVVASRQRTFPVPLRYVFEARQGKSYALNTGITESAGRIIVFGDDDQRFGDDWIDEACAPLDADPNLAYTGGPVLPLWDAAPPVWFDLQQPELLGPPGLFEYGSEPFVFEERGRIAPGGNMAALRALFDEVGGFAVDLGRTGTSLLGQEQAEFFYRSRAAGAKGLYVPSMIVFHHVPPERLTHRYCRRWWYWRGVSRARFDALHPLQESGVDLSQVRRVFGMPRYMIGQALADACRWAGTLMRGNRPARLITELRLAYALGYWRERHHAIEPSSREQHLPAGSAC